jgi:hypothetical protein
MSVDKLPTLSGMSLFSWRRSLNPARRRSGDGDPNPVAGWNVVLSASKLND